MNVTIVGGGNIGTQFAVHCADAGHRVTVYSSRYKEFNKFLEIVDGCGNFKLGANIHCATYEAEQAFKDAHFIFVTTPAFLAEKIYGEMKDYVTAGAYICFVPGSGGMECVFKELTARGCVLCGLQRVPSVARLVKYGKTVCAEGYRDKLYVASLPKGFTENCCKIISGIFKIDCGAVPNYLNITMTPSNPVLHTSRLYSLFGGYKRGEVYKYVPLFYEEWDDNSSKLLLQCDAEVQKICRAVGGFDLSYVKSLKEHYESKTAQQLTAKICSIKSFKGLKTPVKEVEGGFIPDFSSRYFTADFPYGLSILIQIAEFFGVNTPYLNTIYEWYKNITGSAVGFDFSKYGICSKESLMNFYSL